MIRFILAAYLHLFPRCEIMVSFLEDFTHCNDSAAWADHCYAMSDWDYGATRPTMPLTHLVGLEAFVFQLPLVRSVSCWK